MVQEKDKKDATVVSKLKLVNEIPKPAEIRRDPTMAPPKEVLERQESEKSASKAPCNISDSPNTRKAAGSIQEVVAKKDKPEDKVFELAFKGQ